MADFQQAAPPSPGASAAAQRTQRNAELEEIRKKQLAKSWKDAHGNAPPTAPKTMEDFNAEQRRLHEQTRLSQQNAAETLHKYRGTVDEEELKRRAAAEELRRKEIEARQGLHGYRAKHDGSGRSPARLAKDWREADVKAGERRDDVMAGNVAGYQMPTLGEESMVAAVEPSAESAAAAAPTVELSHADEKKVDVVAAPTPVASTPPEPIVATEAATDSIPALPPQHLAPVSTSSDAFEDEIASQQANGIQYGREVSALSDVNNRAKMMRQNISFSFGLICNADVALPPVTFYPTEDHKDFEARVKGASGGRGDNAWAILGRMMSTTETIVQTALPKNDEVGGNFDSATIESVIYDPDYKPYVVAIKDDIFFTPPANQPGVVRRVIKAIVPIFIRSGHVETTESTQGGIVNALRAACARGAFSEAAIDASGGCC